MPPSSRPSPVPVLPPSDRLWTDEESRFLETYIEEQLNKRGTVATDHYGAINSLIKRIASPKGVTRFETVANHVREKRNESLSYLAWLDHILDGFLLYYPQIISQLDTPEGLIFALQPTLARFATNNYRKIFQRYPTPDILDDLISRALLSLHENYYFDVALEPWLWQTCRYLVLNDIRRENKERTVALDEIPDPYFPSDFSKNHIHHDLICESIRKVRNQRYRIILQLIYIYQLNNTELATFFGVSIPRATTWLSRARSAVKKQVQPYQLFD